MQAESYEAIEANLDRLLESTEQVMQRMQQVMLGKIAQDPQIMGRTVLETLELLLGSQKTTKALLEVLQGRRS